MSSTRAPAATKRDGISEVAVEKQKPTKRIIRKVIRKVVRKRSPSPATTYRKRKAETSPEEDEEEEEDTGDDDDDDDGDDSTKVVITKKQKKPQQGTKKKKKKTNTSQRKKQKQDESKQTKKKGSTSTSKKSTKTPRIRKNPAAKTRNVYIKRKKGMEPDTARSLKLRREYANRDKRDVHKMTDKQLNRGIQIMKDPREIKVRHAWTSWLCFSMENSARASIPNTASSASTSSSSSATTATTPIPAVSVAAVAEDDKKESKIDGIDERKTKKNKNNSAKMLLPQRAKLTGDRWKHLSEAEKLPYEERAHETKLRFQKEEHEYAEPKRPKHAWILFRGERMAEKRALLSAEASSGSVTRLSTTELQAEVGREWHALSMKDQAEWKRKARVEKEIYLWLLMDHFLRIEAIEAKIALEDQEWRRKCLEEYERKRVDKARLRAEGKLQVTTRSRKLNSQSEGKEEAHDSDVAKTQASPPSSEESNPSVSGTKVNAKDHSGHKQKSGAKSSAKTDDTSKKTLKIKQKKKKKKKKEEEN